MISKKKLCIMESQPIELSWVKFMLDVKEALGRIKDYKAQNSQSNGIHAAQVFSRQQWNLLPP